MKLGEKLAALAGADADIFRGIPTTFHAIGLSEVI
jgi:hypothetical protein